MGKEHSMVPNHQPVIESKSIQWRSKKKAHPDHHFWDTANIISSFPNRRILRWQPFFYPHVTDDSRSRSWLISSKKHADHVQNFNCEIFIWWPHPLEPGLQTRGFFLFILRMPWTNLLQKKSPAVSLKQVYSHSKFLFRVYKISVNHQAFSFFPSCFPWSKQSIPSNGNPQKKHGISIRS